MAIQTIKGGLWIPQGAPYIGTAIPSFTIVNSLNAAANQIAYVFQVPKTGTLDLFEIRQTANTNVPDNGLRFAFQDLDGSGEPDNTDDQFAVVTAGFGTPAWLVPSGYMGTGGSGSGSKRSVTRGDWLACVVKFESFVAGDSVTIAVLNFATLLSLPTQQNNYVLTSTNSGVNWTKQGSVGINLALKYDDGTYEIAAWPAGAFITFNTRSYNSGSSPDERGLLFQLPFPARLAAVWMRIDSDNAVDIKVYDSADTVLATIPVSTINRVDANGANGLFLLPTPIDLDANSNYRITALPSTGSSIEIYDGDTSTQAIREALDGGVTWKSTSRTDAGAWTDSNTNRPFIGLYLDGFDDAASSGGGEHSSVF